MSSGLRSWKGAGVMLAGAVALVVSGSEWRPAAQEKPPQTAQEKERRSNREERMEQVGPTAYRVIPTDTPYDHWYERAKTRIPVHEGLIIQDVRSEPVKPWPDIGASGLYIRMADYQIIDGWIVEIPPKGST